MFDISTPLEFQGDRDATMLICNAKPVPMGLAK
jgi:hypothetical protein